MWFSQRKLEIPNAEEALPGRDTPLRVPKKHFATGNSMEPPFPDGMEQIVFALGCFWGAERLFWEIPGVFSTAVGYIAGHTKNPTYDEVCSGRTGHTEAVLVVFDPIEVGVDFLLKVFYEGVKNIGRDGGEQILWGILVRTPNPCSWKQPYSCYGGRQQTDISRWRYMNMVLEILSSGGGVRTKSSAVAS